MKNIELNFFYADRLVEPIAAFLPVAIVLVIILNGSNFKRDGELLIGKNVYKFLMAYSCICMGMIFIVAISILPMFTGLQNRLEFLGITPFSIGVFYLASAMSRGYATLGRSVVVMKK